MAMIDPPIENLIDKAGSRYALVTVISKRAKELLLEKAEFFRNNQNNSTIKTALRQVPLLVRGDQTLLLGFAWWWTGVLITPNTRLRSRLYLRKTTRC